MIFPPKVVLELVKTCLARGFLFLFSKQYENNFQKIEIGNSF